MKKFLILILFLCAFFGVANAGTVTVSCSQPTNGSTQPLAVPFSCSATTTGTSITAWKIYLDGSATAVYSNTVQSSTMSTTVNVAAGTRAFVVKAWDAQGGLGILNISVTASAATGVTTTCTSPVNGGTYTNPITFNCSASGGTITGWELYDSSTKVDTTAWSGTPVTGSYTLATGTKTVTVKGYNSTGAVGVYSATVTVNAPPPGGGGGGGGGSTGGGAVTFDHTVTDLTNNNTSMDDAYNTDPNWGWSSWANSPDKWGHVSDTPMTALEYPGATTQWWMYIEPWFNQPSPKACPTTHVIIDSYGITHTGHPFDHGHRCIGFNNNTDAQVTKQIDMMRLAGIVGVNSNLYEPSRDGGSYDAATQRYLRLGQAYTPMFQVMLNYDGGGIAGCLNYSSTDATKVASQTSCQDASDYDATKTATELQNDNCATLPWVDPSVTTATVANDQGTCWGTKEMFGQLAYYAKTYFSAPNYAKWQGTRPIVTFFSQDTQTYTAKGFGKRTFNPDMSWIKAMTTKYLGNPVFLFRQSGGFSKAGSDGAYIWTVEAGADFYTPNSTLFSSFYKTAKASGKITMGSVNVGFNNREASWGSGKTLYRRCGQNILFGMDAINAAYNGTTQLPLAEVATFDDDEEGTGVGMGIENCWRINPSGTNNGAPTLSATKLSFNLSAVDPDGPNQVEEHHPMQSQRASDANLRTVNHFRIWVSDGTLGADGSPKMGVLVDNLSPTASDTSKCWVVTGQSYTIDLSCNTAGLANGTYTFYAEAVGQALFHNHLSAASASYTVNNTTTNQPPVGSFDSAVGLASGTTTVTQNDSIVFSGWAADNEDGAPITKVEIYDGTTLVSTATLGGARSDVATQFNRTDWTNSGFTYTLSAAGLAQGTHTYTAKAYDSSGNVVVLAPTSGIPVNVSVAAPIAALSVTPATGALPLVVTADTTGTAPPSGRTLTSTVVTWGDGGQDTLAVGQTVVTHTYTLAGTYTVSVLATDSASATASKSSQVIVTVPLDNSVVFSSLTEGAFVYSPIRVTGTAVVKNTPISKTEIYVDGLLVYTDTGGASPLIFDQYVFTSAQSNHIITVSVYDGLGQRFDQSVTVFVVSAR